MFENISIYIPTRGRAGKQITVSNLSKELLERTYLLVDSEELLDHEEECHIIGLPENIKGIHNVRQWSVENCKTEILFLIDDDMKFFKRIGDSVKLEKCQGEDLNDMFLELISWVELEDIPLVGLSARQGNNHKEGDFEEATRQMNFHGININRFKDLNLRFDFQEVMEDFHMTLKLLTSGYKNRVMYSHCWNQVGSGAEGGCSIYRTWEVQKEAAEYLASCFPDYVTVVRKKTKSTWKDFPDRFDVRVQWKKAYEQNKVD